MQPYYRDPFITLYHGKQEDVLPQLTISADMVLTDPPYGLTDLHWDIAPDLALMWQHLRQCSKPNAVMALFCQQPFTTDLINSNRKAWRYELIWNKTIATGFYDANYRPLRIHEHIQIFIEQAPKSSIYNPQKVKGVSYKHKAPKKAAHYNEIERIETINTGDRYPTSVLNFANPNSNSTHETTKPLGLLEYLIATYTNVGDLILDPFIGSGSTAVAAAKLGRRCIGIEMREEALLVATQRLAQQPLAMMELSQ